MNTNLFVRNLRGTGGRRCRTHRSWIEFYDDATRTRGLLCARLGCGVHATVGGHILLVDNRSRWSWYIVPLCVACNNDRGAEFFLKSHIVAVPVHS